MSKDIGIAEVAEELGLTAQPGNEGLLADLEQRINDLLVHNFDRLISILYRADVSEKKLKALLKANPGQDAGKLIAALLIKRQAEKIKSREQFSQRDDNISEEDKW